MKVCTTVYPFMIMAMICVTVRFCIYFFIIGLGVYKAGTSVAWRDSTLLPRQIDSLREKRNVQGAIFFSSTSFDKNPLGWNDTLRYNYYKMGALIPTMNWLPKKPKK